MNVQMLLGLAKNNFGIILIVMAYITAEFLKYKSNGLSLEKFKKEIALEIKRLEKLFNDEIENLSKKINGIIDVNHLRTSFNETSSEAMTYTRDRRIKELIEVKTEFVLRFVCSLIQQSPHRLTAKDVDNMIEIQISNFIANARHILPEFFDRFMKEHMKETKKYVNDLKEIINDDMFNNKKKRIINRSILYHANAMKLLVSMS